VARIGILTGGGDCPGLNAVIRGIVRKGLEDADHGFLGLQHGWAGVLEGNGRELGIEETAGLLPRGGTILGTSRTNPYKDGGDGTALVTAGMEKLGLDGLIAIGGEDTLGVAGRLAADEVPVIGVPKTIDNDLAGTDYTFGFDTAVQIASDAIDRLHTTAESHDRVIVVEVMGRHAGWIACSSGIAGGADAILVPERPFELKELCDVISARHSRGRSFSIIVASEGAVPAGGGLTAREDDLDEFGHPRLGGIGAWLEREIEEQTGFETRMVVLGHVQRGGTPTAYDRILATRYGVGAIEAWDRGERGMMVALRGTEIVTVPLAEALAAPKLLDPQLYETAEVFFG
jgi:6-phosphofructokinase 1